MAANALQSMQTVLSAMPELGLPVQLRRENEQHAQLVQQAEVMDETLTPEVTMAIALLWQDPAIRTCVANSSRFQVGELALGPARSWPMA